MDEAQARELLQKDGFSIIFCVQDGPGTVYGDHTHEETTGHIIIDGEFELTMDGETKTYAEGDRIDVPAGKIHSAKMGDAGCTYVVGE